MSGSLPRARGNAGVPTLTSQATPQPIAVSPQPARIPGGAGFAELSLADRIGGLVARRQAQEDQLAVIAADEAGTRAGEEAPGARMEGGGALYRTAFNRAAAESGARRLEVQVRTRLDELLREHEADPEAFGRQAAAYRDGVAAGLPEEMRARFAQTYDALAIPAMRASRELFDRRVADQAIATFNEVQARRLVDIDRLGRQSVRDPAALQGLRQTEGAALEDLVRLGPRSAFELGGRRYEADPTRSGALSVTQLVEQQRRILEVGIVATAMGAFEAGPKSDAWISGWVRRELSPQGSGLAPDLVRRIERDMRSQAAELQQQAREGQARAWGALQDRIVAMQSSLALTGQPGDTITDAELRAAGRTPEQIAAFRRSVAFGQEAFTARRSLAMATPAELDTLEARVRPGGDLFALDPRGSVTLADMLANRRQGMARAALGERVADLVAAGESRTNQAPGQAAAGAPDQAGGRARISPSEGAAAGLTPEQVDEQNRRITVAEDRGRLRSVGATGTPEEVAAARADLPVTGEQAAENQLRLQALEEGLRRRLQANEQPGNYVFTEFAPVAEAWRAAQQDPARTATAIRATLDAQERLGIPSYQRQAVPKTVAQQLAGSINALPTPQERLQVLERHLSAIPDAESRQQLLAGLRANGVPENLAVAAAVQPRAGQAVAGRVAADLAADVSKLGLQPAQRRAIEQTVAGVWEADDRLGGLRRAQYETTRSATFLVLGEQEQGLLNRLGLVRGAPGAALSTSSAREAYGDLFGGVQIINRPSAGVVVSAPGGTDAAQLTAGLQALARRRLAEAAGQGAAADAVAAQVMRDSVWVDAGNRNFVLFARGGAGAIPGPDGRPIMATPEEALAAGAPAPGAPSAAEQRARADRQMPPLSPVGGPPNPAARRPAPLP